MQRDPINTFRSITTLGKSAMTPVANLKQRYRSTVADCFVRQDSSLGRSDYSWLDGIIADTMRPAYKQTNSCFHQAQKFSGCNDPIMVLHMERPYTWFQIDKRWPGSFCKLFELSLTFHRALLFLFYPLSSFVLSYHSHFNRLQITPSPQYEIYYFSAHNSICHDILRVRVLFTQIFPKLNHDIHRHSKKFLFLSRRTAVVNPAVKSDLLPIFEHLYTAECL